MIDPPRTKRRRRASSGRAQPIQSRSLPGDRAVCIGLIYPETPAALAQAERLGRLTARQLRDAVTELDSLFEETESAVPTLSWLATTPTSATSAPVFNLLTMAWFRVTFLPHPLSADGLPELPTTLIGLTGVSTAGYVTKKALEPAAVGEPGELQS